MPASTSRIDTAAFDQANSAWLSSGAKQAEPSAGCSAQVAASPPPSVRSGSWPAWTALAWS